MKNSYKEEFYFSKSRSHGGIFFVGLVETFG